MKVKTMATTITTILHLVASIVIVGGWGYDSVAGSSNIDNTTALPFGFLEWLDWQSEVYMEGKENDGRYKFLLLEENKNLQQLINTIFPKYLNTHYFSLKCNTVDYMAFIVVSTIRGEAVGFYNIVTLKGNNIIATLPLIAELEGEHDRKYFAISETLKITFIYEKGAYNDEEDRWIATEKKEVGVYQIQKDGSIIKVK